ncbi:hypothetical protein MKW98_004060 [Papaver atlanticum]|uniref:SWIM-type domain-containing protein n=1 Tax=Papaver atlanticum TaxID=357466 RepID=A0AAD4XNR7_9MAGN|nr:hypothetical protein MKW98_004060 [Papaver atlanticum]
MSCTCGRWCVNGFPCSHAVQCILRYTTQTVYDYIDPAFITECYRNAYSHPVVPIPDVEKPNEVDESNKVVAPTVVKGPGRQKKKRYIPRSEKPRKKRMCGHCRKLTFHNKITCPDPPGEAPITAGRRYQLN